MLSACLVSCATTANTSVAVGQGIETHTAPIDMGTVYIYRNQLQSSAASVRLLIDDKDLGVLQGNSNTRIDIPQGSHTIKTIIHGSTPSEITINVDAGKAYFVKHQIKLMYIYSLVLMPEEEAKKDLTQTKATVPIVMNDGNSNGVIGREGLRYEGFSNVTNLNGHGKIVYPEKSPVAYYQGEVLRGKPSGRGVRIDKAGFKWEGDFKDGQIYSGIFTAPNGMAYEGDFSSDKLQGKGVFKYPNGNVWKSDFIKNKASGKALITFYDGGVYEGDVLDWKLEGRGRLTSERGSLDGTFKKNKFYSGDVFNNQGLLVGKFANGERIGQVSNATSKSSGTTFEDVFGFSLKLLNAVLDGYNKSGSSSVNRQRDLLGDLNSDIPAPIPVRAVGKSANKSNDDYYANSTSPKSIATDSTISNSVYNAAPAGCTSDFQCGVGNACVKQRHSNDGVCMKSVDGNGTRVYNMPDSNSIGVRTSEGCQFNTDCPVGFSCDATYKACVRK